MRTFLLAIAAGVFLLGFLTAIVAWMQFTIVIADGAFWGVVLAMAPFFIAACWLIAISIQENE